MNINVLIVEVDLPEQDHPVVVIHSLGKHGRTQSFHLAADISDTLLATNTGSLVHAEVMRLREATE